MTVWYHPELKVLGLEYWNDRGFFLEGPWGLIGPTRRSFIRKKAWIKIGEL